MNTSVYGSIPTTVNTIVDLPHGSTKWQMMLRTYIHLNTMGQKKLSNWVLVPELDSHKYDLLRNFVSFSAYEIYSSGAVSRNFQLKPALGSLTVNFFAGNESV